MSVPEAKRRKVSVLANQVPLQSFKSEFGTEIRLNGTITPSQSEATEICSDDMDTRVTPQECPCGHLHGPGEAHFHDISAVGFSHDVMRGPD